MDHPSTDHPSILHDGISIEVLWNVNTSGTCYRRTRNSANRVWWKAKVARLTRRGIPRSATLTYSAMLGHPETSVDVSIFKGYLEEIPFSPVDTATTRPTRLQWRVCHFYSPSASSTDSGEGSSSPGQSALVEKVSDLHARLQNMERAWILHHGLGSTMGHVNESDAVLHRIFGYLRLKLAQHRERPLSRKRTPESNHGIDTVTTGFISITTDCTIRDFEIIARSVRSTCPGAEFQPSFSLTQMPSIDTNKFSVFFPSYSDMCKSISLTAVSDRIRLFRTARGPKNINAADNSYVRLLGTLLRGTDPCREPFIFALARSDPFHFDKCNDRTIDHSILPVLFRKSLDFDIPNMMYKNVLVNRSMPVRDIFHALRPTSPGHDSASVPVHPGHSFNMTWNRIEFPRMRLWSRDISTNVNSLGTLELNLPYMTFFGAHSYNEVIEALPIHSSSSLVQ